MRGGGWFGFIFVAFALGVAFYIISSAIGGFIPDVGGVPVFESGITMVLVLLGAIKWGLIR